MTIGGMDVGNVCLTGYDDDAMTSSVSHLFHRQVFKIQHFIGPV
jgi:hypothetical protein